MHITNKKKVLSIFIATSFILLTLSGCAKNVQTDPVIENKPISTEQSLEIKKQEEKGTVVESGSVLNEEYVEEVTNKEVPIETKNEVMTEEETVNYFERVEAKINEYANSENFANCKDKASSLFITTVDFVFYGGEIKGVTFNSLSNSAKVKILNIVKRMDTTIMKKWPTYKEDVKTTGGNVLGTVTTKVNEGLNYVDTKLEDKLGSENYQDIKDNAVEAANEVKDVASGIWEGTKEVAGGAKEKVKSWYEDYRNKKNNTNE